MSIREPSGAFTDLSELGLCQGTAIQSPGLVWPAVLFDPLDVSFTPIVCSAFIFYSCEVAHDHQTQPLIPELVEP